MSKQTRRWARRTGTAIVAVLLAAPLAAATGSATTDGPQRKTLHPAQIHRAEPTGLLHTEGRVIVDGKRRIEVSSGKHMWLLGRSGRGYVVQTTNANYENWRVLRVDRAGRERLLRNLGRQMLDQVELSTTGRRMALTRVGDHRTRALVVDTRSGKVLRKRWFQGNLDVEAFGPNRLVLSEWSSKRMRTFWWNPANNRQTRISGYPTYIADIGADRLGLITKDDATGTCQKVVRLTAPSSTVWRSCRQRAFQFSPDGRRMVTAHILSDGPGPGVISVRRQHGRLLATYRAQWFGFMVWENRRTVLLETAGTKFSAAIRCAPPSGCERASRLYKQTGPEPFDAMDWSFGPWS